ncbi:MAG TPA: histidine kinase [Gemmatimonadaceae bacterium]
MTSELRVRADSDRLWRMILVGVAVYTSLALLFALQRYVGESTAGRNPVWGDVLLQTTITWWAWGAVTPLVVIAARKLPLSSERRWMLAAHLPIAFGIVVVHALILSAIIPQFYWRPDIAPIRDMFRGRLSSALAFDTLVYCLILAVVYLVRYGRESRERRIAAAELAATLARTQLNALQTQLQPHFLFNTLNSIIALVHEDPARATLMIRRLSDLLRYSLSTSETPEVPLGEEVYSAKIYLEIQKIRFEDRLEFAFDVPDDTVDALVPGFLLQPLVENAVKFSLADGRRTARVIVGAARHDGNLRVSITDNGPGIRQEEMELSSGVGVRTTRARLQQLYGDDQSIKFDSLPGGGASVSISIPLRLQNDLIEPGI